MKKLMVVLFVMSLFSFVYAQETSEPVTNEDKVEENAGKEEVVAPAVADNSAGESKFNKFMNRKGKKALAGIKFGPEIYHFNYLKDTTFSNGTYAGFHTDLFFEYNFVKNFGLQAELNFGGGHYGFFRLPIIAQFNFPITDMFWLNAGAGIYIAAGYWNGFDMGLIGKVALEINTKVGVFIADVRYTPSLYGLKWDWYFGSVAILVGYAVPLPF